MVFIAYKIGTKNPNNFVYLNQNSCHPIVKYSQQAEYHPILVYPTYHLSIEYPKLGIKHHSVEYPKHDTY